MTQTQDDQPADHTHYTGN